MLFGHQDNTHQPVASAATAPQGTDEETPLNPLAVDPQTGASLPVVATNAPAQTDASDEQSVLNQGPGPVMENTDSASQEAPAEDTSAAVPDPSTPFSTAPAPTPAPEPEPAPEPAVTFEAPAEQPAPAVEAPAIETPSFTPEAASEPAFSITPDPVQVPEPETEVETETDDAPAAPVSADADALLSLKQQAILQLSPLVSQLDQSPEEKFRTTMMLIQSTDNSALLQGAYDAARAIEDDKVRAQALLDVVNEINYFTQQTPSN